MGQQIAAQFCGAERQEEHELTEHSDAPVAKDSIRSLPGSLCGSEKAHSEKAETPKKSSENAVSQKELVSWETDPEYDEEDEAVEHAKAIECLHMAQETT